MNSIIRTMIGAGLLAFSGHAAAIMISDQTYGVSGYSAEDFDQAIQAFREEVSTRAERRLLKKARRLDRKVLRHASYLYRADISGEGQRLGRKNRKLTRKEARLLSILDGYLPEIDTILLDTAATTVDGNTAPGDDMPPPPLDELLPLLGDLLDTGNGNTPPGETAPGTPAVASQNIDILSVPEPSVPVLLGLGLSLVLLRRHTHH